MRSGSLARLLLVCAAIAASAWPLSARGDSFARDAPGIAELQWADHGRARLGHSLNYLTVPPGALAVVGDDDVRYQMIENDVPADQIDPDVEADVRFASGTDFQYAFHPTGRTMWDIHHFDADGLLRSIQLHDRLTNDPVRSVGWGVRPTFDSGQHLVSWVLRKYAPRGWLVDSVTALLFQRYGTEVIHADVPAPTLDRASWPASEHRAYTDLVAAAAGLGYLRTRSYRAARHGDHVAPMGATSSVFWYAGAQFKPISAPPDAQPNWLFGAAIGVMLTVLVLAYVIRRVLRGRRAYA